MDSRRLRNTGHRGSSSATFVRPLKIFKSSCSTAVPNSGTEGAPSLRGPPLKMSHGRSKYPSGVKNYDIGSETIARSCAPRRELSNGPLFDL
jgi:hypothetical protein